MRVRVKQLLKDTCNGNEKYVEAIEKSCIKCAIAFSDSRNFTSSWNNPRFCKLYLNIVRNVNIALNKRDDVRHSILSGTMTPDELVNIPSCSLFPDVWERSISDYGKRMRHAYEKRAQGKTTAYRCPKCKQTNCDFTELQLRSADESMTLFITCLDCLYAWRLG